MGIEIERKFLVRAELLPELPPPLELRQGYLSTDPVVRVRLVASRDGESAELTIKGAGLLSRAEFNYAIPPADGRQLLALCPRKLAKRRHTLDRWVIDHFPDRGLWLAEIELATEEEPFDRPRWLGQEVTQDPRYTNASLALQE
jgi:CYTH domain-containing protein